MTAHRNPEALQLRWEKLRTRLEAVAQLLETQGYLECKRQGGKPFWCVRFFDSVKGSRKRRTIYVGNDPDVVVLVKDFLGQCRVNGDWIRATLLAAKVIVSHGKYRC
jgi:hypothetical protein